MRIGMTFYLCSHISRFSIAEVQYLLRQLDRLLMRSMKWSPGKVVQNTPALGIEKYIRGRECFGHVFYFTSYISWLNAPLACVKFGNCQCSEPRCGEIGNGITSLTGRLIRIV